VQLLTFHQAPPLEDLPTGNYIVLHLPVNKIRKQSLILGLRPGLSFQGKAWGRLFKYLFTAFWKIRGAKLGTAKDSDKRKGALAHQVCIDAISASAAFANRLDNQGLARAHVAARENIFRRRHIIVVGLDVSSFV